MRLRPARFKRTRKALCWFAGMHSFTNVRRSFFEDRFGPTGVTPEPGKVIFDGDARWIEAPNACLACMTCGYLKDWLDAAPETTLPEPVWIPPRYRHKRTCSLCFMRTSDPVTWRCESCGVTDEMLYRAGIR